MGEGTDVVDLPCSYSAETGSARAIFPRLAQTVVTGLGRPNSSGVGLHSTDIATEINCQQCEAAHICSAPRAAYLIALPRVELGAFVLWRVPC
jgi:hypothetical protein